MQAAAEPGSYLPRRERGDASGGKFAAVALSSFRSLHHVDWNLTMAAALIFMLPVIVIFFLAQRVFIEGITLTGVKG